MALALAENALHWLRSATACFPFFQCVALEIRTDGPASDFDLGIHGSFAGFDARFLERLKRDRNSRQNFTGWPPFDMHTDTHARFPELRLPGRLLG